MSTSIHPDTIETIERMQVSVPAWKWDDPNLVDEGPLPPKMMIKPLFQRGWIHIHGKLSIDKIVDESAAMDKVKLVWSHDGTSLWLESSSLYRDGNTITGCASSIHIWSGGKRWLAPSDTQLAFSMESNLAVPQRVLDFIRPAI